MTTIKLTNIQAAVLGLLNRPVSKSIHYWNPIETALSALISIAGSHKEMHGYYTGNVLTINTVRRVFKDILIHTAYQIYKHHPDVAPIVLQHPFAKKSIAKGPLARLAPDDRIAKMLGSLMADLSFYNQLREKGYMSWDDGTYEAAIIIGYGWRKILKDKLKLSQSNSKIHFATRDLIQTALRDYPDNDLLKFVTERYASSWYIKNSLQLQQSIDYFQSLASSRKRSNKALILKTLGQSSLIDLGLRYQQTDLIKTTVKKLERNLKPAQKNQGMLLFANAWASVYSDKRSNAKKLALQLANNQNLFLKKQAANILYQVKEEKQALRILQQIQSVNY